jgi:hypothetical protein
MEFINLLECALSDAREGHVSRISATDLATQWLLDFDTRNETDRYEYGREISKIYIVTYENKFPDQLMVEQPEPGSGCAII